MKKNAPLLLLIFGIVSIALINIIYSRDSQRSTRVEINPTIQKDIAITAFGNVLTNEIIKNRLVDISYHYYIKTDSGFTQIKEIQDQVDLFSQLYNYDQLRIKQKPKFNEVEFIQIHSTPYSEIYKAKNNPSNGVPEYLDLYYYQMKDGESKFKLQNNAPFVLENKEITTYKSYQIEHEKDAVHNFEMVYRSENEVYKLLLSATYTI